MKLVCKIFTSIKGTKSKETRHNTFENKQLNYSKYLIVLFFFSSFFFCKQISYAQNFPVDIAEIYSQNKITELQEQHLILLDFWATWCGPCKIATQQLEIIQENLKDDVFMVSITDETHEVVQKYLNKDPIRLMVIRDYNKKLINRFKVTRRPFAILLTTTGTVVWKGHPGDLTIDWIKHISHKYQYLPNVNITDIFNIVNDKLTENTSSTEIAPRQLSIKKCQQCQSYFNRDYPNVEFSGKISSLIARIYNVPQAQISDNQWKNTYVHFESPSEIWDTRPDSILHSISSTLNILINPTISIEDVYVMEVVDKNKLWNKDQIKISEDNSSVYLAGTSRLQADNTSISELCLLLSNEKQKYYRYFGNNHNLYDWDFQFVYDNLMTEELLNEFGIKIRKTRMEIAHFELK